MLTLNQHVRVCRWRGLFSVCQFSERALLYLRPSMFVMPQQPWLQNVKNLLIPLDIYSYENKDNTSCVWPQLHLIFFFQTLFWASCQQPSFRTGWDRGSKRKLWNVWKQLFGTFHGVNRLNANRRIMFGYKQETLRGAVVHRDGWREVLQCINCITVIFIW